MNYEKKNYENTLFPAVTYPYPDGAASNSFLHTDDTEVNEGNYTYTLNRPGGPNVRAPAPHTRTPMALTHALPALVRLSSLAMSSLSLADAAVALVHVRTIYHSL
jgi:hypothetical protein